MCRLANRSGMTINEISSSSSPPCCRISRNPISLPFVLPFSYMRCWNRDPSEPSGSNQCVQFEALLIRNLQGGLCQFPKYINLARTFSKLYLEKPHEINLLKSQQLWPTNKKDFGNQYSTRCNTQHTENTKHPK